MREKLAKRQRELEEKLAKELEQQMAEERRQLEEALEREMAEELARQSKKPLSPCPECQGRRVMFYCQGYGGSLEIPIARKAPLGIQLYACACLNCGPTTLRTHGVRNEISSSIAKRNSPPVMLAGQKPREAPTMAAKSSQKGEPVRPC